MNLKTLTHDMCRSYVNGLTNQISPDEKAQILGWIRSRSLAKLTSLTSEFSEAFANAERLRTLLQIQAFYSKNEMFSDMRGKDNALHAFHLAEKSCRITNKRIEFYSMHPDRLYARDQELYGLMADVKRWVSLILGDFRSFLLSIPTEGYVSGGATCDMPRLRSQPFNKVGIRGKITTTPRAGKYILALGRAYGYNLRLRVVSGNRITTVPKNWKTRRTIACEPSGNCFLQLACDQSVKRRLRMFGVDLGSQSKNQQLARIGALDGSYATIDLKMASDTLSQNVVAELLPYEWYRFLSDIRSPLGYFADKAKDFMGLQRGKDAVKYAKFSSMGNGATFVLETLIFTACVRACGAGDFAVYGDDIVIRTEHVAKLQKLLRFIGFTSNPEKTFTEGPFRESCGVNFFRDVDVTPVYVRWKVRGKPGLCHYVNSFGNIAFSNDGMLEFLSDLVRREDLPFVPLNENTMSGVWLTPRYAMLIGAMKRASHGSPNDFEYKSFVQKTRDLSSYSSGALFLWYQRAHQRVYKELGPLVSCRYDDAVLDLYRREAHITTTTVTVPCVGKYERKVTSYIPCNIRVVCFDEWSNYSPKPVSAPRTRKRR